MRKLAAVCLMCVSMICLMYLGLALYYRNGFSLNTWINGVYCTGKTVEEVNAQLLEQTVIPGDILVVGLDSTGEEPVQKSWKISLQSVDFTVDYTESLRQYLNRQNPWLWIDNVTFHKTHEILPVFSFEEEGLQAQWEAVVSAAHGEAEYRIVYEEAEGYSLCDGLHNCLDAEKAYQVFLEAAAAGAGTVNLAERGCYYDIPLTEEQEETAALWERLAGFQNGGPVYDMGEEKIQLDRAAMAGFLKKEKQAEQLPVLDADGCLQLEEAAVESFVKRLAQQYDTYGGEWEFQSTRGDIVTVKGGTYGSTIDRTKETEWLLAYLQDLCGGRLEGSGIIHTPVYERESFHPGGTIGDTYVEVDMGLQKLYYYEAGELMLETDVVTGNARRKMNTPEGVNYVYSKQKNRVLRGEGYASPVDFWMPVKGAIGIHDADWRKEFGGEIYKKNGSHGCINVPPEVMAQLYDMVETGTPVVMFYGEQ